MPRSRISQTMSQPISQSASEPDGQSVNHEKELSPTYSPLENQLKAMAPVEGEDQGKQHCEDCEETDN